MALKSRQIVAGKTGNYFCKTFFGFVEVLSVLPASRYLDEF
jgi:hypothetical protein